MNTPTKHASSMMPVSGRIPDDLYQWLSTSNFEGATTMSDKLRVGLAMLKRQQEGDADYDGALNLQRALSNNLRKQLSKLEPEHGHSEVLATLLEHAPALMAAIASAQTKDLAEARRLEDLLVQRSMQLVESLMRQAITRQARAYDPQVVTRHISPALELTTIIQQQATHTKEGN
jgi:hypothetical protein